MSAPSIDEVKRAGMFDARHCGCCGAEEDEKPLYVYGTLYRGQVYWSRSLCSVGCHDAIHSEVLA